MKISINNPVYPENAGQTMLKDSSQGCGFISTKLLVIATLIMLVLAHARLFAQPPTILVQPTSRVVWAGANVRFGASTGSIPPTSYFWLFDSTNLPSGMFISTVAGNGASGYSGDGGPATSASLNLPRGVLVDAFGDLLIADTSNNRIRKVGADGNISTFAGNGTNGYSGDGGAATNASLNLPSNVAMDASGNLFIADAGDGIDRIRKVDTNGIITTVAGKGTTGFSGDNGAATNAALIPLGVTVDNFGNLFIADAGGRIRKVNTNGIITTVAGGGMYNLGDGVAATNTTLNIPFGVAVDAAGNLFIADTYNQRVRLVNSPQWPNTQLPGLSLTNVTAAIAGNYQEVVTDPNGSVTSDIARLTVVTSPLIYQTVLNSNGSFALNFVCKPTSTNVVLCATNLLPPVVWQPISTNVAGADGDWKFTDTNAAAFPTRFYRSLTQ